MLTSVQQGSVEVYYGEVIGSKESYQKDMIYEYVRKKGRVTGRMISKDLGLETSTVSARVNSLVKDGKVFRELSINKCPISERGVHWIYSKPTQMGLI